MDELEYTLKMNKRAILFRLERVQDAMKDLQTAIESDNFHGDASITWADGHAGNGCVTHATANADRRVTYRQEEFIVSYHIPQRIEDAVLRKSCYDGRSEKKGITS